MFQENYSDYNQKEKEIHPKGFLVMLLMSFVIILIGVAIIAILILIFGKGIALAWIIPSVGFIIILIFIYIFNGFFTNNPNDAKVVQFFGTYVGTVKDSGFHWLNPLVKLTNISLKSHNVNGNVLKINDKSGNPITIGCVFVWKVKDTFKAKFEVQDYFTYVNVQSEAAVRYIGCQYNYDKLDDNDHICLKSGSEEISDILLKELSNRFSKAGIEVEEARISELAYATEVANVMLRRQAAQAIISAREIITQGSVSIVAQALKCLKENDICEIFEEDKRKLIANMIIILISESQVSSHIDTDLV